MYTSFYEDKDITGRMVVAYFNNFHPNEVRLLTKSLGDFGLAYRANISTLINVGIKREKIEKFCAWRKTFDVNAAAAFRKKEKIHVLWRDEPRFPTLLNESHDPPEWLFIRGSIPQNVCLSFVGSRKCSSYGQVCVNLLIKDAVSLGITTVSGLALGIDGMVHKKNA